MGTKVNTKKGDDEKFKFQNAGDTLKGEYLGSESFDYNGKTLTKHRVKGDNGKTVGVLGGYTLNEALPQVPVGAIVTIKFLGKKSLKGGRTIGEYDIEFDEPQSL